MSGMLPFLVLLSSFSSAGLSPVRSSLILLMLLDMIRFTTSSLEKTRFSFALQVSHQSAV